MTGASAAFASVKVDPFLKGAGWDLIDIFIVCYEWPLPVGAQVYCLLCDRQGQLMASLEAKIPSTDPVGARIQGVQYTKCCGSF